MEAAKFLSAAQARALLATVRPRDIVGRTRRQLTSELVTELASIDKQIKTAKAQLQQLVAATGSGLLELNGIGPSGAARLIGDVGDIARFPSKAHFASWNGTAPLDASSGDQTRHRLSRAGNRRINRTLHIMAIVQLRNDTEGRRYFDRKRAAGKTGREAMRCLKRRLSDAVYRQMLADSDPARTAREDNQGRLLNPARPTHTPTSTLRISLFPGPPPRSLELHPSLRLDTEGRHERMLVEADDRLVVGPSDSASLKYLRTRPATRTSGRQRLAHPSDPLIGSILRRFRVQ